MASTHKYEVRTRDMHAIRYRYGILQTQKEKQDIGSQGRDNVYMNVFIYVIYIMSIRSHNR